MKRVKEVLQHKQEKDPKRAKCVKSNNTIVLTEKQKTQLFTKNKVSYQKITHKKTTKYKHFQQKMEKRKFSNIDRIKDHLLTLSHMVLSNALRNLSSVDNR